MTPWVDNSHNAHARFVCRAQFNRLYYKLGTYRWMCFSTWLRRYHTAIVDCDQHWFELRRKWSHIIWAVTYSSSISAADITQRGPVTNYISRQRAFCPVTTADKGTDGPCALLWKRARTIVSVSAAWRHYSSLSDSGTGINMQPAKNNCNREQSRCEC